MAIQAPTSSPSVIGPGARRFELDWLRALVVLGLIPYHAAVVFAVGPGDYVKSPQRHLAFDLAATVVSFWGMPLLFLVSGAATWYALGRRSPGRYLGERAGRLAIPFVVGVLVIVPVQLYYGRRAAPGYNLSYLQFYQGFLIDWAHIAQHGVFGLGFQYWGHLWFVLYLLAVSVFLLPLLVALRSSAASKMLGALAARSGHPLVLSLLLFLLGAPFAVLLIALQAAIGPLPYADYTSIYDGVAALVLFAVAFFLGYVLFADQRFQRAVVRARTPALLLALGLLGLHEVTLAFLDPQLARTPWGALAVRVVRAYITWYGLVAILGFAQRHLAFDNAALRYLNEAVFPLYVLHMPVLTVLAFYIVRLNIPIATEYLLLVVGTAGVTFALYDLLVRRISLLRFLFGLKARRRAGVTLALPVGVNRP